MREIRWKNIFFPLIFYNTLREESLVTIEPVHDFSKETTCSLQSTLGRHTGIAFLKCDAFILECEAEKNIDIR